MKLALLKNNTVKSIVDVDTDADAEEYAKQYEAIVDITEQVPAPQVGWYLLGSTLVSNGANGEIKITKLALRQRFTFPELIALHTASQTEVALQVLLANVTVATFIDLNRADTIAAMGLLVSMGLLTSERMNVILSTPPAAHERYVG